MTQNPSIPSNIQLHQLSRTLELEYEASERYELSCEYLRVYSPSAEVRGHGPGQEVLQVGKKHVAITKIKPVGNYALQFTFSDGHDTGIYTWKYLYDLATTQDHVSREGVQRDLLPIVEGLRFELFFVNELGRFFVGQMLQRVFDFQLARPFSPTTKTLEHAR